MDWFTKKLRELVDTKGFIKEKDIVKGIFDVWITNIKIMYLINLELDISDYLHFLNPASQEFKKTCITLLKSRDLKPKSVCSGLLHILQLEAKEKISRKIRQLIKEVQLGKEVQLRKEIHPILEFFFKFDFSEIGDKVDAS